MPDGGDRHRVLVPDRSEPPAAILTAALGDDCDLVLGRAADAGDVPDEEWRTCDAVLAWHEITYDADLLARMERCRVLVRIGVGFDNVDLAAAGRMGITVCNVPDYGTQDVADHTYALMLALVRGLGRAEAAARDGAWSWRAAEGLRRLTGRTLGILGLGRIGSAVARRAAGFGLRVVFHDPYLEEWDPALTVEPLDSRERLLREADIVTVHTPLTDETRGMVDADFLHAMTEGGLLVNTARGPICDLDAVHDALRSGRLAGAAFDVLPVEPPGDHPLVRAWREDAEWLRGRLHVTPHCAFYNEESHREMQEKAAAEALRVLRGEEPLWCVNRAHLAGAGEA